MQPKKIQSDGSKTIRFFVEAIAPSWRLASAREKLKMLNAKTASFNKLSLCPKLGMPPPRAASLAGNGNCEKTQITNERPSMKSARCRDRAWLPPFTIFQGLLTLDSCQPVGALNKKSKVHSFITYKTKKTTFGQLTSMMMPFHVSWQTPQFVVQ